RIDAGDQITLRAFTRRGYLESINLKVFGVFRFDGLEASELAGTNSLIDLVSLRSLYGADDTETSKELEAIRRDMGLEAVSAESAVDDLFRGAESDVHAELTGAPTDWSQERETLEISRDARSYDAKELSRGLVLNVAVILEDPKLLTQTLSSIENRISRSNLELVAVGWQEASGMMGQFVAIVRAALATSLLIVFMVAIAVITTIMVMATMQRTGEYGTMRAMGSPKHLVFSIVVTETVLLGSLAGLAGASFGVISVFSLQAVGVPAGQSEVLTFLFSGERLFPTATTSHFLQGITLIVAVSALSALYPAWIATRVQPVVAMQGADT
ncbi:MAG: FtsX-like permease family protein, partial [Myxococcota bacterium]